MMSAYLNYVPNVLNVQEAERLAEEQRLRKEEEEQRRMEEEQLRLLDEAKKAEEERLLQAIEVREENVYYWAMRLIFWFGSGYTLREVE